jgi:Na+/H+-translocating membrane pyrophosphatase
MKQELGMSSIGGTHADSIGDPIAMAGVLFGACLPFVFSGLNVVAIGTTTQAAVEKMKAEFERQRRPQNSEHQQDEPDVKNLVSGPVLAAARGTAFAIISTVRFHSHILPSHRIWLNL